MKVSLTVEIPYVGNDMDEALSLAMLKIQATASSGESDIFVSTDGGHLSSGHSIIATFPVEIKREDAYLVVEQADMGHWGGRYGNKEDFLEGRPISIVEGVDSDGDEGESHLIRCSDIVLAMHEYMYMQETFCSDVDDLMRQWDAGDYDSIVQIAALGEIIYG